MSRKVLNRLLKERNPFYNMLKPKVEPNNLYQELRKQKSILMTLFNEKTNEIVNMYGTAPSPSKDYCQVIVTFDYVLFRCWRITLRRSDSDKFRPGEIKDSFEDFADDDIMQNQILTCFGGEFLNYLKNIVVHGKMDYLSRLPENILLQIISNLTLEDVSRLAQTNKQFRELCRSDRVWMVLYQRYYSKEITKELLQLAQKKGWRTIFFTNKIKLQVELRRQTSDLDSTAKYGSVIDNSSLKNTISPTPPSSARDEKFQALIRRHSLSASAAVKQLQLEEHNLNLNNIILTPKLLPKAKVFLE